MSLELFSGIVLIISVNLAAVYNSFLKLEQEKKIMVFIAMANSPALFSRGELAPTTGLPLLRLLSELNEEDALI